MTLSNEQQAEITSSEAYQISLLEEKLQVARRRRKVGEVVIRKQIETCMVQVPIRREKLVVERRGQHPEQLAEVILREEKVNGFGYGELNDQGSLQFNQSHFLSLPVAQEMLAAIQRLPGSANVKIRLEIVSSDPANHQELQKLCDRFH